MVVRARARGSPAERALGFSHGHVVDAGVPAAHQTRAVELPELVPVRPEPVTGAVVPLVLEAHGDMVPGERPELIDQPVVLLPRPFALQKLDDGAPPGEKLRAVAPG